MRSDSSPPDSQPQDLAIPSSSGEPGDAPGNEPPPRFRPDHREMYLLIAGLVVGLLLSPYVLGRFLSGPAKEAVYFNARAQFEAVAAFDQETLAIIEQRRTEIHERSKVDLSVLMEATPVAMEEFKQQIVRDLNGVAAAVTEERRPARQPLLEAHENARSEHLAWTRHAVFSLVLASALLMFLEPLFEPAGLLAGVRRRMAMVRYLVCAMWIGWVLAQPYALESPPLLWPLIIAGLALAAAVLPWIAAGARKEE